MRNVEKAEMRKTVLHVITPNWKMKTSTLRKLEKNLYKCVLNMLPKRSGLVAISATSKQKTKQQPQQQQQVCRQHAAENVFVLLESPCVACFPFTHSLMPTWRLIDQRRAHDQCATSAAAQRSAAICAQLVMMCYFATKTSGGAPHQDQKQMIASEQARSAHLQEPTSIACHMLHAVL